MSQPSRIGLSKCKCRGLEVFKLKGGEGIGSCQLPCVDIWWDSTWGRASERGSERDVKNASAKQEEGRREGC